VQHVVDACDCPRRDGHVGEVALDELHAGNMRKVPAMAGAQIVDDADLVMATDQLFGQMRSDEARAAGDKV
jgi:hypothetical protein